VNQLVLSGTATLVLSRTRSSCYRGPESRLSACCPALSSRSNFTNQKSFGFLLTAQTTSRIGGNWKRRAVNPSCRQKRYRYFTAANAYGSPFPSSGAAA
jgi:hypothetical protein